MRRVLACCAGGGHLKQLTCLIELVPNVGQVDWLTHDTALGRQLRAQLVGSVDRVFFAPHPAPREVWTLLKDARVASKLLSDNRYDLVLSTGGTISLAVLPLSRLRRIPTVYIESATRGDAPSTSGRLLSRLPGIRLFTQHETYAGRRWKYIGSVFDEYEPGIVRGDREIQRVLVTVGTMEAHDFRRLIERVLSIAHESWDITWQVGPTKVDDLGLERAYASLPAEEMSRLIAESDVVIAHAGTGTALTAFEHGVCPVLVPRRQASGEHVDDHQRFTLADLSRRGLAIGVEVDELSPATLQEAARRTVRRRGSLPPLPLE